MQEEFRKNFILLSRVAKEKKYAQEYLGLLARRGDIGSIRIGKRWYTTEIWFEEFLESSRKKKNEVVIEQHEEKVVAPVFVKELETSSAAAEPEEIKISFPAKPPVREKVLVGVKAEGAQQQDLSVRAIPIKLNSVVGDIRINKPKIAVSLHALRAVEEKYEQKIQIRQAEQKLNVSVFPRTNNRILVKNTSRGLERNFQKAESRNGQKKTLPMKFAVEHRNEKVFPRNGVKYKSTEKIYSPVFETEANKVPTLFPRFALAFSFLLMIFFLAVSGYFIYSGGLLENGKVAGISSEEREGLSGIKSGSEYYLGGTADKMRESLSISRAIMEAIKEKAE